MNPRQGADAARPTLYENQIVVLRRARPTRRHKAEYAHLFSQTQVRPQPIHSERTGGGLLLGPRSLSRALTSLRRRVALR